MQTSHTIKEWDSRKISFLDDESINLVVTSPPYPMIEMWDKGFNDLNSKVGESLKGEDFRAAFELMHCELDKVWSELYRVLCRGGIACINIGDAVRTVGQKFVLFTNHHRIIDAFLKVGFDALPLILWRKQTNAPNKFMGSGMLPAGAYVTLEHEYILIFRKSGKRIFKNENEKKNRRRSAIFWEERNKWYSDLWDFKGVRQDFKKSMGDHNKRSRSAAFPFELPYRLINMHSVYGDTVLDPFAGSGTTLLAAMACARNSLGLDNDSEFAVRLDKKINGPGLVTELNRRLEKRQEEHERFIVEYNKNIGRSAGYINHSHQFPVVTKQEIDLKLLKVDKVLQKKTGNYIAIHK